MEKADKLIEKARSSPQNITFDELCFLFENFGFVKRGQKGSHLKYKQTQAPCISYVIQRETKGKAKGYQVKWLLNWVDSNVDGK